MSSKMSSINWIKITDRAREGIEIINKLNNETFATVLEYVHKNMNPSEDEEEQENALEDLEKLVAIPRPEFLLLIKTLSYILKRTSTFLLKPTKLQQELREKLKLDDDKIDGIIRLWIKNTKPILTNLHCGSMESKEVTDVSWMLNLQISSNCQQKERTALACLQLKTGDGNDIDLEMNHSELLNLFNQFENIQNELDNFK